MSDCTTSCSNDKDADPALVPLLTSSVAIDGTCTGARWVSQDDDQLAQLVALVAMGQAAQAAHILAELGQVEPAFTTDELIQEAIIKLSVQEKSLEPRTGYPRWQRDGFIFEAISWIAALIEQGDRALVMDPHIKATTQGIDGLMIRLSKDHSKIVRVTILEDKCSERPRTTFRDQVIPAFLEHHGGKRSSEVVAAATTLLRIGGFDNASAAKLAAAVTNRRSRSYRAALALTDKHDSQPARKRLFKGYDALDGISAKARIGASFVVSGDLRDWFDQLAQEAVLYLNSLEGEELDV